MAIEVTSTKPIVGKRYAIPFAQRETLSAILGKLLENDIIRPSSSPHAASVVLVQKASGESRMCVDYRVLNEVTVKKHFPMPIVDEQLSKLAGGRYFTTLDMTSGYYQVPLEEASKKYTAFLTHQGLYEHNVMPFGLVNAPMYFQEMVTGIIAKVPSRNRIVSYVDEVIIATATVEEGLSTLRDFLQAITEEGLTLKPSKCVFLESSVKFLGHVVSAEGIQPSEEKTECIQRFPTPTNSGEVRQFLGITGFFRKFVRGYSLLAQPLTKLLKKNVPFSWTADQEQVFRKLKTALSTKPVLTLFDPAKSHEVHTDACSIGISGILFQVESTGVRPVFYYSRQCTEAEKKYSSHELEVLAIVEALSRFRIYLLGSQFTVITDCNSVATTKASSPLSARVSRWWLKLQEFNFTCVHRPATQMAHADGMSRAAGSPPTEATTVAECVLALAQENEADWVATMQLQDDDIKAIVDSLRRPADEAPTQVRMDYELKKCRLYRRVHGERKLVVPKAVRWRIVRYCHDESGHFGTDKTVERISKDFWFPRIRWYVKSYIAACPDCCLQKAKGGKPEGQLHVTDAVPVPFR